MMGRWFMSIRIFKRGTSLWYSCDGEIEISQLSHSCQGWREGCLEGRRVPVRLTKSIWVACIHLFIADIYSGTQSYQKRFATRTHSAAEPVVKPSKSPSTMSILARSENSTPRVIGKAIRSCVCRFHIMPIHAAARPWGLMGSSRRLVTTRAGSAGT